MKEQHVNAARIEEIEFPIDDLEAVLDYLSHRGFKDYWDSLDDDLYEEEDIDVEEKIYQLALADFESKHIYCNVARLDHWLANQY